MDGGFLDIEVLGVPVAEGSTRAWGRGGKIWTTHANAKVLMPWRQEVAAVAAKARLNQPPREGVPFSVEIEFFFDKPKSTPKRVTQKITRPDLDKLIRSILDALTGIVWKDDAQVVHISARKGFGPTSKARITAREVVA